MLALGRNLYSSGLDQGDEFDADRNGVALAARAGFDPYGLPSVLQQLRTAAPDNPLFTPDPQHASAGAAAPGAARTVPMGNGWTRIPASRRVSVAQRLAAKR